MILVLSLRLRSVLGMSNVNGQMEMRRGDGGQGEIDDGSQIIHTYICVCEVRVKI